MQNVLEQGPDFRLGSIQLIFRTIVFTQYMQRCFQSQVLLHFSQIAPRVCTLVLFILLVAPAFVVEVELLLLRPRCTVPTLEAWYSFSCSDIADTRVFDITGITAAEPILQYLDYTSGGQSEDCPCKVRIYALYNTIIGLRKSSFATNIYVYIYMYICIYN